MQAVAEHIDYKALYEQLKEEADITIASLKLQLEQLKKMIFGSKHERFVAASGQDNPQLTLDLNLETIAACKITDASKVSYIRTKTEVTENKPKAHPGRMKLPGHLRREVILVQPATDVTGLKKLGDEVSELLDYVPGELYVKQYIRPKYVQPLSEVNSTVITPSLPGRIMEKCMAGEGLLAQIIVDKYVDHLPLHRQSQRFSRIGLDMAQSTINGWTRNSLDLLVGLYDLHKQLILSSGYINADET